MVNSKKVPNALSDLGRITGLLTDLNKAVEAHGGDWEDILLLLKKEAADFVDKLGSLIARYGLLFRQTLKCDGREYHIISLNVGLLRDLDEALADIKMRLVTPEEMNALHATYIDLLDGFNEVIISKSSIHYSYRVWDSNGLKSKSFPRHAPVLEHYRFAISFDLEPED